MHIYTLKMSSRYNRKKYVSKYKRPGYKFCGRMVFGDAKKALIIAKGVRRLLNVEIKNFDSQQTNVAITTVSAILPLTNISQGDTTSTRDGAQVKMVGLEMNYMILRHPDALQTNVRIMVVLDKQTNQAQYISTDLFEDASVNDVIVTARNLDNKHRFQILYDRTHSLHDAQTTLVVKKYIKKDVLLRYDASTPSIADLTQNSISFLQVGTETASTPVITSFLRIRFIDN